MGLAAPPVIGPLWVRDAGRRSARWLFYLQGIADRSATPAHEVDAHSRCCIATDGGRAFRQIVRGFELDRGEGALLRGRACARRAGRRTILWGERDPALGEATVRAVRGGARHRGDDPAPAKHFLQEDQAPAVADAIADLAGSA